MLDTEAELLSGVLAAVLLVGAVVIFGVLVGCGKNIVAPDVVLRFGVVPVVLVTMVVVI